jgi:lipoate-protein ligase A
MSASIPTLNLIQYGCYDVVTNMQVDEHLFEQSIQAKNRNAFIRFYGFSEPSMTVGYGMWNNLDHRGDDTIAISRRITGGGVVYHGADLTYSIVLPMASDRRFRNVKESYRNLHQLLQNSLFSFGISTQLYEGSGNRGSVNCFDGPVCYDVMMGSRKVAGAGQKRSHGYLLHQGSIAWPELVRASNRISKKKFSKCFSHELAQFLQIPLKEVPFLAVANKEADKVVQLV